MEIFLNKNAIFGKNGSFMQMYVVVDNWSLFRDKFGTTIGIAEFGVVVVVWMCLLAQVSLQLQITIRIKYFS